jgi:hypothetical protein
MSVAATKRLYSPEEYLALERISPIKSEYYRGEIFAMAGASREHNLITGNVNAGVGSTSVGRAPVQFRLGCQ